MAVLRVTASMITREIFRSVSLFPQTWRSLSHLPSAPAGSQFSGVHLPVVSRSISYCPVRCSAASNENATGEKKAPARLAQVQEFLVAANERAQSAGNEPIPKITLDHVTVNFARSGGPGGQNVNKVNTKVDMRFNVRNADWLSERVKERIMQMEKNRINKDGELVISSTRTRTQKGNIEDALAKLQAIIDEASYVPPPPSEETVKKITKFYWGAKAS
ncbi:uncharacterized protein [Coffea arabica]|uniref:Uncharacterized protein isoform X4 n=1 Tax=Coffea arabica TaxID=13443 RepID=A0ABM4VED1_COFAR